MAREHLHIDTHRGEGGRRGPVKRITESEQLAEEEPFTPTRVTLPFEVEHFLKTGELPIDIAARQAEKGNPVIDP